MSVEPTATGAAGCRCCGHEAEELVLSAKGFPALCNAFDVDAARARAMPTGRFELLACTRCGSLRNAAFDPDLLPYDDRYENSLHGSGTFGSFASELAADLAAWRPLTDATVVEVGSGQGDFLRVLAEHGPGHAYGLDPSLVSPVEITDAAAPITLLPGTLDDLVDLPKADLLLSRHVLEHVTDPLAMLTEMRERFAQTGTAIYVEVPDATYMVQTPALWDLIHEHVGYFTAAGLRAVLQRAGWTVDEVGRSFGDQYLWARATCSANAAGTGTAGSDGVTGDASVEAPAETIAAARRFGQVHGDSTRRWTTFLDQARQDGKRVAVWGAGSKGVAFLNAIAATDAGAGALAAIDAVIDVNERKRHRFVPGVGTVVETPGEVAGRIDTVLVMNPIYLAEIRATGETLGFDAEYLAVDA